MFALQLYNTYLCRFGVNHILHLCFHQHSWLGPTCLYVENVVFLNNEMFHYFFLIVVVRNTYLITYLPTLIIYFTLL